VKPEKVVKEVKKAEKVVKESKKEIKNTTILGFDSKIEKS